MGTKGRFPRDGLGAQASCCSSGSLFWGGSWGPGQKSLPAEDSRAPETVSTASRALGQWFLQSLELEGRSWRREAGSGNSLPREAHHDSGLQRGSAKTRPAGVWARGLVACSMAGSLE